MLQGKALESSFQIFASTRILESNGKLGRGKRVEIPANPATAAGVSLDRTLVVEAYDDFPSIALVSTTFKNTGSTDLPIDRVQMQQHHA